MVRIGKAVGNLGTGIDGLRAAQSARSVAVRRASQLSIPKGDQTIYALFNGKMTRLREPNFPNNANFVIVCDYGDWSGFRTLDQCVGQFDELEAMAAKAGRGNFYYKVVER